MDSIRRTFRAHIPLYVCSVISVATIATIFFAYGITPTFEAAKLFLGAFLVFVGIFVISAAVMESLTFVRNETRQALLQYIGKRLIARLCAGDRIGNTLHSAIALFPLLIAFIAFKSAITLIHPFRWDKTFSDLDRAMGFGHQPWELLQPFLGHAPITMLLAYTYYAWFLVLFTCLAKQAFAQHSSSLRMQLLLAMAFAFFFGGCIAAVLFSSAGPCYFAHLNLGFDPYLAQLSYLHGIGPGSLPSVIVQNALWNDFANGSLGEGISAMPSMHVLVAVVIGLFGWRRGGLAAVALPVFALLIVLGSIHLAWHYACDTIAGASLAVLFWYVAGRVIEFWDKYRARYVSRPQPAYEPVAISGAGSCPGS